MVSGEESSEDSENLEELYRRLQVVMDSLSPKCKEIFILGCAEGLSYKDVAEQLGVSVNTVKTQRWLTRKSNPNSVITTRISC